MTIQNFSETDIKRRIKLDNRWWEIAEGIDQFYKNFSARPYLNLLYPLISRIEIRRAVVLMGPRRVGKTVILHHAIQKLIDEGINPGNIFYAALDTPIFTNLHLEKILSYAIETSQADTSKVIYCFFDEIQYLKDWETHLKSLVDTYRNYKFIVSGSAAAALRLKSLESGAGRFTNFTLPPLTFYEYLELTNHGTLFKKESSKPFEGNYHYSASDLPIINEKFESYINFGGYPELLTNADLKSNMSRFVKSDIIDKVLLKDLPGLYGIQDIQELNSLFTKLAYNTGNEVSLDELSKNSGVAKNTIKRYLEYLEAAFLIFRLRRVDHSSKTFKRDNFFKIYLVNSTMRGALFSPISSSDANFGHLVETAILSQWFHSEIENNYYARWKTGEVDLISLEIQKPAWAVEIKWSNRVWSNPNEQLGGLISYCLENNLQNPTVTTIDIHDRKIIDNITIEYIPASVYCYTVGRNLIFGKKITSKKNAYSI